jgi:hypothetical protein
MSSARAVPEIIKPMIAAVARRPARKFCVREFFMRAQITRSVPRGFVAEHAKSRPLL